jgi:hypothetical protein
MYKYIIVIFILFYSCKLQEPIIPSEPVAYRESKTIKYNQKEIKIIVDKPASDDLDVLMVFHGTVLRDSNLVEAANNTLDSFKALLDSSRMMIVSVIYPQEKILLGDNVQLCESALLWLKYSASSELGIKINKIFLAGHSQGAYVATRLNTIHQTNGVIANAPGPLNLIYRCKLEEDGKIKSGLECSKLKKEFGSTTDNPDAYFQRSLMNYTNGYKSDILFIQGLDDSPIQLYSWPTFKQEVLNCTNCNKRQFVEVPQKGHGSLFQDSSAQKEFNLFLKSH